MRENVVGENPQLELRPPNPARALCVSAVFCRTEQGTMIQGFTQALNTATLDKHIAELERMKK